MAIQFLPRQDDSGIYSGLGQMLGIGLGGLGTYGLNKLTGGGEDQEVNQLIQAGLMSPDEAKIYKRMKTPQERSSFLNNVMKQSEGKRQAELISRAMGGSPMGSQDYQMGQSPMMGAPANIPQPGIDALGSLGGSNMGLLSQLEQQRQNVLNSGANPMLVKDAIASIDRQIDLTLKKESIQHKQNMEERKQSFVEQREVDKETKTFYDKIQGEAKEAKKANMRLNRMEELVKKGDLSGPFTSSVLNSVSKGIFGFGIDLGGLTNADTQEFKKISTDFLKGAKQIFGSRITQREVEMFLDTVPTLQQSDEGKLRVINNLRIFNDAADVEKEAMDEIIAEHGGRRPRDLESLVEKRSKEILDNLADQFKKGVRGSTPEEKVPQITKFKPEELTGSLRRLPPFISAF